MTAAKQRRMQNPKVQYQVYQAIARCQNNTQLNAIIRTYFHELLGEITYEKYYGDLHYDHDQKHFELWTYTHQYQKPIVVPIQFVKSLYLVILLKNIPKAYYQYRQHQIASKGRE